MNGCHSGHLRLRSERNLAYPAGAQEGRHQGFHPLVNHPFPIIARRKSERRDRSEKRNGSRVTAACLSLPFRSSQTVYCYTGRKVCASATQGELPEGQERVPWGITVSRNSFTRYYAQHLRITPTHSLPSQLFTLSAIFHFQFSILHTEIDNQNFHKNRVRPHFTVRTLLFT